MASKIVTPDKDFLAFLQRIQPGVQIQTAQAAPQKPDTDFLRFLVRVSARISR